MEQNKLETQFKEKLNSREIKPTEMAWDRLDAMLSVAENKKPKHKFTWLYIAASFIGFLLISSVLFNQKENTIDINKNSVVIENAIPKEASKSEIKLPTKELNSSKTNLIIDTKPLVQRSKRATNNHENLTINTPKEVVAEPQPSSQNESIVLNKSSISTNIDSLLASVEKQNPEVKKGTLKINSTSLLNQVDGELQLSFREKALNTITKKYKEAKEALANRNNQ